MFPSGAGLNGSSYQRVLKGCSLYWLPVLRLSSSPLFRLSLPMTTRLIHTLSLFRLHKESQTSKLCWSTLFQKHCWFCSGRTAVSHTPGDSCARTHPSCLSVTRMYWWDSQNRGSVIVSCLREAVLLCRFSPAGSVRLIWLCKFHRVSLKTICKPDPYLPFPDLNTPDLYYISIPYLHIRQNEDYCSYFSLF